MTSMDASPQARRTLGRRRPAPRQFDRRRLAAWACVTPLLFGLIVFAVYPFLYLIVLSLLDANLAAPFFLDFSDRSLDYLGGNLNGGENYADAFEDEMFVNSLWRSALFALMTTAVTILTGIAVALLVDRAVRARQVLRTIILLPLMTPPITVGIMWKLIYMPQGGWLNSFLTDLSLISAPVSFLGDNLLAFPAVMLADVWQWTPFVALMTYAALQTLPEDVYEAAKLDGATDRQVFFRITLPMLAPALLAIAVLKLVIGFKVFDLIHVLTAGGPGSVTMVSSYQIYEVGVQQMDIGLASAETLVFALVVGLITLPFTIGHDVAERRLA